MEEKSRKTPRKKPASGLALPIKTPLKTTKVDSSCTGHARKKGPTISTEWTRDQVLGRTGNLGPKQSVAFRFEEYGGQDLARAAAEASHCAQS
jgi:hypothetical protein